jgi:hypothetical protein
MINLSSAMGGQFAWSAAEMTAEIKRLGPNPLRANGAGGSLSRPAPLENAGLESQGTKED